MIFSKALENEDNKENGSVISNFFISSFLNNGFTIEYLEYFKQAGNIPDIISLWVLLSVPRNSDPRKNTLARASSIYKRQTRSLLREGAPQNKTVIVKQQ
jgi:hypothetical protein